jgi:hypothetical protein
MQKHLGLQGILSAFLLGAALSLIFWQSLDPRALGFVVVFLVSWETLAHIKWRVGMICAYCGFDPILYKRSPEAACAKVKEFMENRKKDPMFYLSSKGYDKIARRKILEDMAEKKSKLSPSSVDSLSSNSYDGITSSQKDQITEMEKELLNMPPV